MKKIIAVILFLGIFSTGLFAQYMRISNPDRTWRNTGVTLTENVYSITDKGAYSEVNSYLSFKSDNPNEFSSDTQVELYAYFRLPESYEITNLWLWVGDEIMEARMYDRWTAERIYEGIVNRRKDPAIIYKNGNGWYELRIYPFKPTQERKIRLTYLVPNTINSSSKSVQLPDQIQKLTTSETGDPGFLIFTDLPSEKVKISGESTVSFESGSLEGEPFLKTTLPTSGYAQSYSITKEETQDSLIVRTYSDGEEQYFDISLMPFEFIDNEYQQKILFLVNLEMANTDITTDDFYQLLRENIKNYLSEEDSFNVFFSGLNTIKLSEDWIKAEEETIDSVFSNFEEQDKLGSSFSNMDNLLTDAYDFVESSISDASIFLIASTQNYSNINSANTLLDALAEYSDGNFPPTFIADIQTKNFNYEWRNGRYYLGNEYLYLNLTRDTAGELTDHNDSENARTIMSLGMESVNGNISEMEIYPLVNGGFSFGRFSSKDENSNLLSSSSYQVGKYTGSLPFNIQISGFYRDEVFAKQIEVSANDVIQVDSTLEKIWIGQRIKQLENASPSNEEIADIIDMSLEHRILSKYTSFLALEPSDTVFACATCIDESAIVPNEEDVVPESFEIDSLSAYPNPFNPSVNINVEVSEFWDASNSSIDIYNIIGQKIVTLNTQSFSGLKNFQVTWDVSQSSSISTGVYLVVLKTPYTIKTLKITYLK